MTALEFSDYSQIDFTPHTISFKNNIQIPFIIIIHESTVIFDLMKRILKRSDILYNIKIFHNSEDALHFILNNDIDMKLFNIFSVYEKIYEIFRHYPKIGNFLAYNGVKFFYRFEKLKTYVEYLNNVPRI